MQVNKNHGLAVSGAPAQETTMGCEPAAAARCSKCQDLQRECSAALREHLGILAGRDAARKRRDQDLVEAFEDIENESLEKWNNARQAIVDHEVTHILERKAHSVEGIESLALLSQ